MKVDFDKLQNKFGNMLLSPSGFRKVFAESENEEDTTENISNEDKILVAVLTKTFSDFLKQELDKKSITVAIAKDSRPTGDQIADIVMTIAKNDNLDVKYFSTVAAPEIMAFTKEDKNMDALIYISASHNPIGHNGFKFCLSDGAVLIPKKAKILISNYKENIKNVTYIKNCVELNKNKFVDKNFAENKKQAEKVYWDFSLKLFSLSDNKSKINELIKTINSFVKKKISIVAEFNGSARAISIDKTFFNQFEVTVFPVNDIPGKVVHRIVPEGKSLNLCKKILEDKYVKDRSFILGYVPDNDGDRGNIVYIDENCGRAKILEAQQVFALSVLSELAFVEYIRGEQKKSAIAVNCCTSNRVVDIAKVFNTKVFRGEVGEANIVQLADSLRKEGYTVRILGEGSNGGNITHPATVRDPLNTVGAIIKLLTIPELYKMWCKKIGIAFDENYILQTIIDTLPKYSTVSAFEKEAQIKIKTTDHAILKANYENIFPHFWEKNKNFLKQNLNISKYEIIQYEGSEEKRGAGKEFRSGDEKGGFKVEFFDNNNNFIAFIWMRGSGTEPVFRILSEVKGDNLKMQKWLLSEHKKIIKKADV